MTDQNFIEICNNSISMSEAAKKMNINFSSFKRKSQKLNCYKPKQNWRKGGNSLSDPRIKSKYDNSLFCERSTARRSYVKGLIVKNNLIEYKCNSCELGNVWNKKLLGLHLDHINGIRNDNRLENLRFLCPNCHSQTETYCVKNKMNNLTMNSLDIDNIISCISESYSITNVINNLGVNDTRSNRTIIKKIISSNKIDLNIPTGEEID